MSSALNELSNKSTSSARVDELLTELKEIIANQESRIAGLRQQRNLEPFSKATCGQMLLSARETQQLTLENLALLSGVSTVTLSKLEKGQLNVNFETLVKVFDALGVSLWIGK
ncbi:helix-turn-helix domain-containing protein [Marinobacterium lutimaris]|uniref:Helix-turn-helix n=1 Tax=Marinobacterium lutimaris TaxID=568106 RepID=A0A1H6DWP7_9GAMM|nr:helix-turn-helix transcriptional regulator [Marinobacterium lutimaris]SEG89146.1 Helix-turn-helix [Marinobacterium lutimaris]